MKTILTICAAMLLFVQTPILARDIAAPPAEEPVLAPDVMPSFRGDADYFRAWFNSEVVYPKKALGKNIDGDIEASFVIEKNGDLTNIEILKSADELFRKEAIRVLKKSPSWSPGTVGGVAVRTRLTMPLRLLMPGELLLHKGEIFPAFRGGGRNAFSNWVNSQLQYPKSLLTIGYDFEQTVEVGFTIDEAGRVRDIKILNDCNFLFSDEVVRVLKMSPKWTPGYQDGKKVKVRMKQTFKFRIR